MSTYTKDDLLALIRNQSPMTMRQQLLLTAMLSAPAIMAQLSSILMQYIDASMLGRLGAMQAASVGLVPKPELKVSIECLSGTTHKKPQLYFHPSQALQLFVKADFPVWQKTDGLQMVNSWVFQAGLSYNFKL